MIEIRKSDARGSFDHGWLQTKHTFSFADYHDSRFMGFRSLRVINEDVVAPGSGFGTHPHRDMEIITWVLEGSLEHRDSMGTGSVIRPGDAQKMSAGTGVLHSEMNASTDEPVHLLQIWILPERKGIRPGYEQKHFAPEERKGALRLIASNDGREGSITVHQDVDLYAATIDEEPLRFEPKAERSLWLQVARGTLKVNGTVLTQGDGAAIRDEQTLEIAGDRGSELLLFDMA